MNMNAKKMHLVELDDGFIGSMEEVAKHLGVSSTCVYDTVRLNRKKMAKKHDYKDLGMRYLHTIYQVLDDTGVVIEGNRKEIADKLYYSTGYIDRCIKNGKLGDYRIKKVGEVFRKEPMGV